MEKLTTFLDAGYQLLDHHRVYLVASLVVLVVHRLAAEVTRRATVSQRAKAATKLAWLSAPA